MKKLFVLLALLLLSAAANAYTCVRTFYFVDCQTGADAACAANIGANGNAGTIGSPKQTNSGITQTPGDCYIRANGGAWTGGFNSAAGNSGTNPIVWDNYVPSWCTGGCTSTTYPKLNIASGGTCIQFSDGSGADHDEGYYVAHHECVGSGGAGSQGVFIYNDADYITLDTLIIHNFELGFYCGIGNSSPPPSQGANLINEKIQLLRSQIYEITVQGLLTNCDHTLIEGNTFHDGGAANPTFDHNVYISGNAQQSVTVRWNTIYNEGLTGGSGSCNGTSFVAHGIFNKLLIEYNYVYEPNAASSGCYLMSISTRWANGTSDGFAHTTIRGNLLVNGGSNALELEGCQQCVIEDNAIVYTSTAPGFDHTGIRVQTNTGSNSDPDYICSDGLVIRNNSIYLAGATANSVGIISECEGTGHVVTSNLVYMGASSSASAACFSTGAKTQSAYATWDKNLCFRSGGTPTWVKVNGSAKSLAQAQALSPALDTNGVSSDPLFVSTPSAYPWSLAVQSGSPAKNAGHATQSLCTKNGLKRVGATIGAFDPDAAAACPGGPTRYEIQ